MPEQQLYILPADGWWNNQAPLLTTVKRKKGEGMKFVQPKVGLQIIRVDRIRGEGEKPSDEEVDKMVTEVTEKGLPEPLKVFWNLYDWPQGYVDYKGSQALLGALRVLGHSLINADVQIDPASGLQAERKEYALRVERRRE